MAPDAAAGPPAMIRVRLNVSRALAVLRPGLRRPDGRPIPCGEHEEAVPAGTTVRDLVRALHPDWDGAVMVVVNGAMAPWDQVLAAGDEVGIHPILSGGQVRHRRRRH